jgi:hypothetical protein
MRFGPPISFARRRDGRNLAYQVVGDGELDLVFLFGFPTSLALIWDNPAFAGFLQRLSSFSRLIVCERLGNGLSDPGADRPHVRGLDGRRPLRPGRRRFGAGRVLRLRGRARRR